MPVSIVLPSPIDASASQACPRCTRSGGDFANGAFWRTTSRGRCWSEPCSKPSDPGPPLSWQSILAPPPWCRGVFWHDACSLPGLIALSSDQRIGLLHYRSCRVPSGSRRSGQWTHSLVDRRSGSFGAGRDARRAGARGCLGRHLEDLGTCRMLRSLLGLFGLERLERLERAPELGHDGAAVAHQRVEAAGGVAVADQGEPGIGVLVAAELEHFGLQPIGALQAPGGDRDAAREQGLQDADRRQLREDGGLERRERRGVFLRQQHVLVRCMPCLGHFAPSAPCRLANSGRATSRRSCDWPRHVHRSAGLRRARRAGGGNGRARRGAIIRHGGISLVVGEDRGWLARARGCGQPRATHHLNPL